MWGQYTVYTKPTKTQDCIKYECDAPPRYKHNVVYTLLNRAWKISSTILNFETETRRIKSLVVNNGFPNRICDRIIEEFKAKKADQRVTERQDNDNSDEGNTDSGDQSLGSNGTVQNDEAVASVKLFYRNQFSPNYKTDENIIKNIIKRHVLQVSVKLHLLIYYKNRKISDLIKKNNASSQSLPDKDRSHLVYEFRCQEGGCQPLNITYIGLTTCTLKERLTGHRYQGSIFEHYRRVHGRSPEVTKLLNSTKILYTPENPRYLSVYEALHIKKLKPVLNENLDFRCLKLNIS